MSKHTPGPWSYSKGERHNFFYIDSPSGDVVYVTGSLQPDHVEANARLIAAAPELLDLLERVTYHMEGGIRLEYPASPEESPQPASEWDHEADRLAGEARRLLAKATGGAQ
ncbi:hypothetical protein [Stenotrophomonas maltophilia]|uniref:Uncharacterized protein n=1 Tax=Stenotrophomonas maltophilia TaxID=40324 RepID=A0A2W6HXQ9_STEMA|nr:hypothetical protein [Stenotrophomonas maltophilia]PZS88178.1 hypothetical protein A7X83_15785 [Stenotrophomonas maltophilia]